MDSLAVIALILSSVGISLGITWLALDTLLRIARVYSTRMNRSDPLALKPKA